MERTECDKCKKLDERDEPWDQFSMPVIIQTEDGPVMLSAADVEADDMPHLCDECEAAYMKLIIDFMGKDYVIVVPDEDDDGGDDKDA